MNRFRLLAIHRLFRVLPGVLLFGFPSIGKSGEAYTGVDACVNCHEEIVAAWKQSDHARSMEAPGPGTVLGDFSGVSVEFHGISTRFRKKGDDYLIETRGDNGVQAFNVAYTFGHFPLQQYLIETGSGHLQAFDVAWDSRSEHEGGQRWFHLQPDMDINPDSPFFWTASLQNWNSRCADCHSTAITKNYDVEQQAYNTTFSEVNVSCEACHGPAGEHVAAERAGQFSPLLLARNTLAWKYDPDNPVATPSGRPSDEYIDMCGGCHSRRGVIGKQSPGRKFADQYDIALVQPPLYHVDGQILDEVFVMGSFMQSKMHAAGVTCSNCHEPHSGKVLIEGEGLCLQCHNPTFYKAPEHPVNRMAAAGLTCVDCHMPETTYMQVDARRDHKFVVPGNRDDGFGQLNSSTLLYDPLISQQAFEFVLEPTNPAIQRATLLSNLTLTPLMLRSWPQLSTDKNALVRAAAVRSLEQLPGQLRAQALSQFMGDSAQLVRFALGRALSLGLADIAMDDIGPAIQLVNEYRVALNLTADTPGSQTSLAILEANLGKSRDAAAAFQRALDLEPNYVPALLNYADYHRNRRDEEKASELLKRAVEFAPDSGAANFSYALSLVRMGRTPDARTYFRAATEQQDAVPRYAYVYAVALESLSDILGAITVLSDASKKWPNQFDLLMLQVAYLEKSRAPRETLVPILRQLQAIAPDADGVRQRLDHYGVE